METFRNLKGKLDPFAFNTKSINNASMIQNIPQIMIDSTQEPVQTTQKQQEPLRQTDPQRIFQQNNPVQSTQPSLVGKQSSKQDTSPLNMMFSYQKDPLFARFKLSDYVSIPSFESKFGAEDIQVKYANDFDDIFNCVCITMHKFKDDEQQYTHAVKFLLLVDLIFEPFFFTSVINTFIGSEKPFGPTFNDDREKLILNYIARNVATDFNNTNAPIMTDILKKVFDKYDIVMLDQNEKLQFNRKTLTYTEHVNSQTFKDFKVSMKTADGLPTIFSGYVTKQRWFINIQYECNMWGKSIFEADVMKNAREIIEKSVDDKLWMNPNGTPQKTRRYIQGDVLVRKSYILDQTKSEDVKNTSPVKKTLLDRQSDCMQKLGGYSKKTNIEPNLRFISVWNRIQIAQYMMDNITSFPPKPMRADLVQPSMELLATIVLIPVDYLFIIDTLTEILDSGNLMAKQKYDFTMYVVLNFHTIGIRDPHDYSILGNSVYMCLRRIFARVSCWCLSAIYNRIEIGKVAPYITELDKNPSLGIGVGIEYLQYKDIGIPTSFVLQERSSVDQAIVVLAQSVDMKKFFKTTFAKPDHKYVFTDKSVMTGRIGSGLKSLFYDLQTLEYTITMSALAIKKYIISYYDHVKPISENLISEICTLHSNDDKDPSTEITKIADRIKEIFKLLRSLNKISPKIEVDLVDKSSFHLKTVELEDAFTEIIFQRNLIPQPSIQQTKITEQILSDEMKKTEDRVKELIRTGKIQGESILPEEIVYPNGDGGRTTSDEYQKFIKVYTLMTYLIMHVKEKTKEIKEVWTDIYRDLSVSIVEKKMDIKFGKLKSQINSEIYVLESYFTNINVLLYVDKVTGGGSRNFIYDNTSDYGLKKFIPFLPYVEFTPTNTRMKSDFYTVSRKSKFSKKTNQ